MMVSIVDTGIANFASVISALDTLGCQTTIVRTQSELDSSEYVVLPGVGSFSSAMKRLHNLGLSESIRAHVNDGKPLLAICLGFQLLCDGSEESPGVKGLGIIPGICRRLPDSVRIPHLGWNWVDADSTDSLVQPGMAAFANSFALVDSPDDWTYATTKYGRTFVSAVSSHRLLACQFHPELSGTYGLDLIARWLGQNLPDSRPNEKSIDVIRVISCLDVKDGRVVKGVRFQDIRDAGDPAALAHAYATQGADEIVVLDIAASPRGESTRLETIRQVRTQIHIPLTVGGGVRTVGDARSLLKAGADKISVNSAATRNLSLVTELAAEFGSQCVVCAVDARKRGDKWEVLVNGGRDTTLLDAIRWSGQVESLGAGEILLTSWDRDGTRSGVDKLLLQSVSEEVNIPVIASGGIGSSADAIEAVGSGASAVLAASIFHDADFKVEEIKQEMKEAGIGVRL